MGFGATPPPFLRSPVLEWGVVWKRYRCVLKFSGCLGEGVASLPTVIDAARLFGRPLFGLLACD